MKIIGIPQQKPNSNISIFLRPLSSNPMLWFPPIVVRHLYIQNVHAGEAVEAPMISLAGAGANRDRARDASLSKRTTHNLNITPHGASSQALVLARLSAPWATLSG